MIDFITIAKVCHQANKAWCEVNGDDTQKNWMDAEQWQVDSAITGVIFRIKNPNAKHDAQHNSWMLDKIKDGWVYGEVKDAEKKTHPCIVPFEQLPEFQQKKDALFCAIVDALKSNKIEPKEMTFGEKLVGITFNSSANDKVTKAKQLCAELADLLKEDVMGKEPTYLSSTLYDHAIGEILNAQMNVVKVLTLKY